MDKDKQIEEMAKMMNECCNRYDEQGNLIGYKCYECEEWSSDNHFCRSYNRKEATALYNAGYRKAEDVAREIFEEIEFDIHQLDFDREETRAIAIEGIIAELKKKYTTKSEGEE